MLMYFHKLNGTTATRCKICNVVERLLLPEFKGKDIIINQLNHSTFTLNGEAEYLDVLFQVDTKGCDMWPYGVRVPLSMLINAGSDTPVDVLLHMIEGYVHKVEIYNCLLDILNLDFEINTTEYYIEESMRT